MCHNQSQFDRTFPKKSRWIALPGVGIVYFAYWWTNDMPSGAEVARGCPSEKRVSLVVTSQKDTSFAMADLRNSEPKP